MAAWSCSSAEPTRPLEEHWDGGGHFGPDGNYVLPSDAGGSYKEEKGNVTNDTAAAATAASLCPGCPCSFPACYEDDDPARHGHCQHGHPNQHELPPAMQSSEQWRR